MELADRTVMLLGGSGLVGHAGLAAEAYRLLQDDAALRQHIISVGLPIVAPDDPIEPSRFATWVFTVEDKGTRIKR